jgi:hypothetical protein
VVPAGREALANVIQKAIMTEAPGSGKPDSEHIRADQPENLREWSNRLGVSVAELKRIITEVGDDPDKIRAYLNTRA